MRQKRAAPKSHPIAAEDLLQNQLARRAVQELTKAGIPSEELLKLVLSIPGASKEPEPLVRGIDKRVLRAMPDRIKGLASQIRTVNDSPWLSPNHLLHQDPRLLPSPLKEAARPERAKLIAEILLTVPSLLDFYAEHLCSWLKHFHPTRPRKKGVGDPKHPSNRGVYDNIRMQTLLTLRLLGLIRSHSGRPHHEDVATLLAEAYRASGQTKESAKINAEHLKKLEKNNPELYLLGFPFDLQASASHGP